MPENNPNNIETNVPSKGLITDYSKMGNGKDIWTYARNVAINSQNGDIIQIQNEPATKFCCEFPYSFVGSIKLKNDRWLIATTNNTISEIGIFSSIDCSYTKVGNNSCLNFNLSFPIFGVSKDNNKGEEVVYWVDGQNNEIRTLNLDKIPYTYTTNKDNCKTKNYSNILDCNEFSFTKKFSVPSLNINTLNIGSLSNGSYQVAIAYSVNGQKLTDYYSVTNPEHIWNHAGNSGAISVTINNLDRDFDSYKLLLIATVNNVTTYYELGDYNITQTSHIISNINPTYIVIPSQEVSIKKTFYQKADNMVANDQHLIIVGPSVRPKLNYQKQALQIVTEYVVFTAPLDYYRDNNKVGYYRDETYPYTIQWLYDDGEWTDLFNIVGRKASPKEKEKVYGKDVFDQKDNCDTIKSQEYWQIYNTAGKPQSIPNKENCKLKKVAKGVMAYHESTDIYPDDILQYGELACTPIRHHTFPDECIVPRYTTTKDGEININILGVQFSNIPHPIDEKGKKITSIVGYRIWRGDRANNKRIIARGIATNVRSYTNKNKEKINYTNYPFNDLSKDQLLSEKQTSLKKKEEKNYVPLTKYSNSEFTFYSPHTLFDRIGLGNYMQFETIETSRVEGFFEEVYKHPKSKLISNNVLAFALLLGGVDGYLKAFTGQKTEIKYTDGAINASVVQAGTPPSATESELVLKNIKAVEQTASGLNNWGGITAGTATVGTSKYLLKAIQVIGAAGAFVYFAAETAQKVIDLFYQMSSWKQYALQYNAHAFFNKQECVKKEQKLRRIDHYQYLSNGINTIQDRSKEKYNNLFKENNIYIRLNDVVTEPKGDNSRASITRNRLCNDITQKVKTTASVFYTTVKNTMPNQYGQIDSIKYLSTSGDYNKINIKSSTYNSEPVLGGDCFINRFSFNNKTDFFGNVLYDQPDGFAYDYKTNNALAYPRYWIDTHQYDFSEIVPTSIGSVSSTYKDQSNLPQNKYDLDCKNKKGLSLIKDQYFYTTYNGVFDFIVESDYNLDLRDWKEKTPDFYTKNNDLSSLFKNKGDDRSYEEFIYDKSYSKELKEEFFYQFPIHSDKLKNYYPNMIAYTLPSFKDQKYDNWLNFLPNNFYDFSLGQFGKLTTVKIVDNQQLLFLFDKSSPYMTPGRQELKATDKSVVYLGDGSLIRDPRPLLVTDDHYGNCQSRFAFNQTKYGLYYPSQRKGNWFQYSKGFDEISKNGMFYWFDKYLPSFLLKQYPNFQDSDNPINGVGLLSAYDSSYETLYLTKKDWEVKEEYIKDITYDKVKNRFLYKGLQIPLGDKRYFNDTSFTISYNPSLKLFVSWHDYQPVSYINNENHFFSIVNEDGKSSIHEHNVRCDAFSNFYGKDYPHAFELPINNGQNVNILKSIEYLSDTLQYKGNCKDYYQLLDTTYDMARISNQEQISGNLHLNIKEKNNMLSSLKYDQSIYNPTISAYEIYVDKSEQKYRFNKFADIVKDRGEFTQVKEELINTDNSGYKITLNNTAIDYNKSIYQKKKFRNTETRLYLEKTISDTNKIIFYLNNSKQLNSTR